MSPIPDEQKKVHARGKWQKVFTWMLLANLLYIILFFLIMKNFT